MRSQMNYDIVVRQDFKIPGVEYVAIRAAREIISTEKPAHMDPKIPTAAGDQNFHFN
jgi:hypothetical protein